MPGGLTRRGKGKKNAISQSEAAYKKAMLLEEEAGEVKELQVLKKKIVVSTRKFRRGLRGKRAKRCSLLFRSFFPNRRDRALCSY